MSVVGSVLTVGLGIVFGFRMVVWIGAVVYAVALLASFALVDRRLADTSTDEGLEGDLPAEPSATPTA
ncbi:MAG: hypothetical protein ACYTFV_14960 [Planctomycetota bacterium]|jgi:hypothetical protein